MKARFNVPEEKDDGPRNSMGYALLSGKSPRVPSDRENTETSLREDTMTQESNPLVRYKTAVVPAVVRPPPPPPAKPEPGCVQRSLEQFIIIPDESRYLDYWDVFIFIILLITVFFEPYSVAVLHHDPYWAIFLNHSLDCIFTFDMILQFFIAYGEPVESSNRGSLWEKNVHMIAKRYCGIPLTQGGKAGWFWIDLMTVLPGWMESFLPEDTAENSKPLVLFRLLRLVRLTKLVRLEHLVRKWHQKYGFPFYVVELCKFLFITTLTVHCMGCLWIIIEGRISSGKLSYRTDKESWLSAMINAKGDSCSPDAKNDPVCVYFIAVYWATMTLTTVGYGDIIAQNPLEYLVCTLCMLFVAYVWAYIVGKIVTILEALDPHEKHFRQQTDDLQTLMDNRRLPYELQVRLRKYVHEAKNSSLQLVQQEQLNLCISKALQREVAMCSAVFDQFRNGVYWAKALQQDALLDLVRALRPHSYGPNEIMLTPQTLVIMRRGIAAARGRVLNRGDIWGMNDILLVTDAIIESTFPRTLSYVDVLVLHKSSLTEVCNTFPNADKRIRRAQIRTAVFRAFIKTARERSQDKESRRKTCRHRESTAATSFVNPGKSKLHMSSQVGQENVSLSDLRDLIMQLAQRQEEIAEAQDKLSAKVDAALKPSQSKGNLFTRGPH